MEKTYSTVYKGGRCWNGFHKDAGTIVHLVEGIEPNGWWGGKALCGTETGKRSYGWASTDKAATCTKCISKRESIEQPMSKKKVSPFEYAIMQYADPEAAKEHEPYTRAEQLKQREENLMRQAEKLRIKKEDKH